MNMVSDMNFDNLKKQGAIVLTPEERLGIKMMIHALDEGKKPRLPTWSKQKTREKKKKPKQIAGKSEYYISEDVIDTIAIVLSQANNPMTVDQVTLASKLGRSTIQTAMRYMVTQRQLTRMKMTGTCGRSLFHYKLSK